MVMSMMPAVFRPYSAGKAPVISSTLSMISRAEALTEHRNAFGENDAVQTKLNVVVVVAHVELTETILTDARHLKDYLI